jgi:hypothetical protein
VHTGYPLPTAAAASSFAYSSVINPDGGWDCFGAQFNSLKQTFLEVILIFS